MLPLCHFHILSLSLFNDMSLKLSLEGSERLLYHILWAHTKLMVTVHHTSDLPRRKLGSWKFPICLVLLLRSQNPTWGQKGTTRQPLSHISLSSLIPDKV